MMVEARKAIMEAAYFGLLGPILKIIDCNLVFSQKWKFEDYKKLSGFLEHGLTSPNSTVIPTLEKR